MYECEPKYMHVYVHTSVLIENLLYGFYCLHIIIINKNSKENYIDTYIGYGL